MNFWMRVLAATIGYSIGYVFVIAARRLFPDKPGRQAAFLLTIVVLGVAALFHLI